MTSDPIPTIENWEDDKFNYIIDYIKDNNISSEKMYVSGYNNRGDILTLYLNIIHVKCNRSLILIGYDKDRNITTDIIPKELLELFSIETLIDILTLCSGSDKAIDPEFKDSKTFMQAEIQYKL